MSSEKGKATIPAGEDSSAVEAAALESEAFDSGELESAMAEMGL